MTDPYPDITGFKPTDTIQAPAGSISTPLDQSKDIATRTIRERTLIGLTTHQTADVWIATEARPIA